MPVPKAKSLQNIPNLMLSNCIMILVMNVDGPTAILHGCTSEKHPAIQPDLQKAVENWASGGILSLSKFSSRSNSFESPHNSCEHASARK